jgi:cellobiose phosphorylase
MYRIWIEEVLGFQLRGDRLTVNPVIPDDWPGFEITYRFGSARYEIAVSRHEGIDGAAPGVEQDGRHLGDGSIQLVDDGATHRVAVRVPKLQAAPVAG